MEEQKKLIKAKTESLKKGEQMEELYINAMNAMRRYNGQDSEADDES